MTRDLRREVFAEFVGTAFLLAAVVGSGIMAERLSTDVGLQLLENAIATGAVLIALILGLGAASGAHFNPAVTLAERAFGGIDTRKTIAYIGAQVSGAVLGVMTANVMFDLDPIEISTKDRSGGHLAFAEGVATLGLLLIIFTLVRSHRSRDIAYAVGLYITGAYYFTSSTSFANPAVTLARTLTNTFAGIDPAAVPLFLVAQFLAVGVAVATVRVIYPDETPESHDQTD